MSKSSLVLTVGILADRRELDRPSGVDFDLVGSAPEGLRAVSGVVPLHLLRTVEEPGQRPSFRPPHTRAAAAVAPDGRGLLRPGLGRGVGVVARGPTFGGALLCRFFFARQSDGSVHDGRLPSQLQPVRRSRGLRLAGSSGRLRSGTRATLVV